jgi:hypothetical protein
MEFDREEMRRELAKARDEFTCSKNERAFLDEIRESFEFDYDKNLWCRKNRNMLERSYIYRSDFTRSNLSELVEGKG